MGEVENAPREGAPDEDVPGQGAPGGGIQESGAGAPEPYGRTQAMVTGAAYGALGVFGFALGVIGSFLFSVSLGPVPVAALGFVVLNVVLMRLAGWAMGTKLGAVIPTVTWLVVVFALSAKRPEGDLVITGTTSGYLFIVGGSIAAMIGVALTRGSHSWLLRGADASAPVR